MTKKPDEPKSVSRKIKNFLRDNVLRLVTIAMLGYVGVRVTPPIYDINTNNPSVQQQQFTKKELLKNDLAEVQDELELAKQTLENDASSPVQVGNAADRLSSIAQKGLNICRQLHLSNRYSEDEALRKQIEKAEKDLGEIRNRIRETLKREAEGGKNAGKAEWREIAFSLGEWLISVSEIYQTFGVLLGVENKKKIPDEAEAGAAIYHGLLRIENRIIVLKTVIQVEQSNISVP